MNKKNLVAGLALGIALSVGLPAIGVAQGGTSPAAEHATLANVAVPMRDGVILRANVWLPKAEGQFPTLVYRTPYGKDGAPKEWTTFDKAWRTGMRW